MATLKADLNEFPKVIFVEGAAPGTPPTGFVYAYAKGDGRIYGKDDTGTEFSLGDSGDGTTALANIAAHLADTGDAHDASAISIADAGAHFTGTDVEAALQELGAGGGGGGGDLVLLANTLLGSAALDITFTGISGAYSSLLLLVAARSSTASSEVGSLELRCGNGSIDTGSNYGFHRQFTGSGTSAGQSNSATAISAGMHSRDNSAANRFALTEVRLIDYANTARHKLMLTRSYHAGHPDFYENSGGGVWKSTSAIDQIRVFCDSGNLMAGSSARLYGLT